MVQRAVKQKMEFTLNVNITVNTSVIPGNVLFRVVCAYVFRAKMCGNSGGQLLQLLQINELFSAGV